MSNIKDQLKLGAFIVIAIILPCMLASNCCYGQMKKQEPSKDELTQMLKTIPRKEGKIFYDQVVLCDSLKKDDLFIRIRQWFVENFTESKAVLEVNDITNGLLTGKGTYKYSMINGLNMHSGYTLFVINVAVKDGKFRYQLYDFTAENRNQSMLSSTSSTTKHTINLDEVADLYNSGKREGYARKLLEPMLRLVYFIDHTLYELKGTKGIQEF
jgi:hypothetical protein